MTAASTELVYAGSLSEFRSKESILAYPYGASVIVPSVEVSVAEQPKTSEQVEVQLVGVADAHTVKQLLALVVVYLMSSAI